LPIAFRVLIADAVRNGYRAVLLLSPIARLLGRGDTTRSRRSNSHQPGGSVAPAVSIESRL
jgi:hypothetical protein